VDVFITVLLVVIIALVFDFTNGFGVSRREKYQEHGGLFAGNLSGRIGAKRLIFKRIEGPRRQ
jgi:hypothetical protein